MMVTETTIYCDHSGCDSTVGPKDVPYQAVSTARNQGWSIDRNRFHYCPKHCDPDWVAMKRTNAVLQAVLEAGECMTPAEIKQVLWAKGRDDNSSQVSAALSYLKSRNVVRKIGPASWKLVEPEPWKPE